MYKFKILFLLLSITLYGNDFTFKEDKKKHFGFSFAFGVGTSIYLEKNYFQEESPQIRLLIGSSLAVVPGLAKEILDEQQSDNKFDIADMSYNLVGAIAGNIVGSYISKGLYLNPKDKTIIIIKKF